MGIEMSGARRRSTYVCLSPTIDRDCPVTDLGLRTDQKAQGHQASATSSIEVLAIMKVMFTT
jgi:hypothetical protein